MEQLKRRGMTGGGSASPPSSPPSSSQPRTSSSSSSSSNATYGKAKLERHLQRKALRQIKESESAGGSSRDSDIGNDSTTAAASSRKKHPHLTASSILTHANRVQKDKDTDRDLFARKTLTRALSSESAFAARDASGSSTGPSSSAPEAVLTGEKRKRGVVALTLPTRDRGDAGTRASPIVTDVDRSVLSGEIAPLTGKGSKGESSAAAGQPKKPADPVPTKAKNLITCPFCERPMPKKPSPFLCSLIQPWLDRFHADERITVTDVANCCARHDEEVDVIPSGIAQGWPATHRWKDVRLQVYAFKDDLYEYVQNPESSYFMRRAREFKMYRNKSVLENTAAMEQTQAGFYGEEGWTLFRSICIGWMDGDAASNREVAADAATSPWPLDQSAFLTRIHPLSTYHFIDLVLIPELTCMLIKAWHAKNHKRDGGGGGEDGLGDDAARDLKAQSTAYGLAAFPVSDDGIGIGMGSSATTSSTTTTALPSRHLAATVKSPPRTGRTRARTRSRSRSPITAKAATTATATTKGACPRIASTQPVAGATANAARGAAASSTMASRPRPKASARGNGGGYGVGGGFGGYYDDDEGDLFNRSQLAAAKTKRVATFDELWGSAGAKSKPKSKAEGGGGK